MSKTTEITIAEFLQALINDHTESRDPDLPQIMGRSDGSEADVNAVTRKDHILTLNLTDGTRFSIQAIRILKG